MIEGVLLIYEFQENVLVDYAKHISKTCLVLFKADWCTHCYDVLPKLESIANQDSDVDLVIVDVDKNPFAQYVYEIKNLPTVWLFVDGEPIDKLLGSRSESEYQKLISDSIRGG